MNKDILIVDDEPAIREVVGAVLEDEGYQPRVAANSDEALREVAKRPPALVLLDIWLEGSRLDGVQILDQIKTALPDLPVIMFSGHGTIETAVTAIKKGAYDFIEKPFNSDRLLLAIERALEAAGLRREVASLKKHVRRPELVGGSQPIARLRQAIDKAAPTNSRVLIAGPPGCGKEVVARLLHERSRRAAGPFVVLNASGIEPERLDVELFGAEAGYANPEQKAVPGLLERADNGTLLLDEIADLPPDAQGRVLKALQGRSFSRMGSQDRCESDVRIIAITNRDLKAEMAAGQFREDLYYRLNVVPLEVPALTEHRTDIPDLVAHFMRLAATSSGLNPRPVSDEAMAVLQTADWPGDVRQLKNAIEWMLIMAPGDARTPIGANGLPPELTDSATRRMDPKANGELVSMPLREAREHFERSYLQAQLQRFGGNISRTANFVGMERSALHRKLKTLGLHSGED